MDIIEFMSVSGQKLDGIQQTLNALSSGAEVNFALVIKSINELKQALDAAATPLEAGLQASGEAQYWNLVSSITNNGILFAMSLAVTYLVYKEYNRGSKVPVQPDLGQNIDSYASKTMFFGGIKRSKTRPATSPMNQQTVANPALNTV